MKCFEKVIILVFVFGLFITCKTAKEPIANYYKPLFDQSKKVYISTPNIKEAQLDTLVLIRSNLRDKVAFFSDTLYFNEPFYIESGELAVPIELINAKPPKFDVFLVAKEYVFKRDYIDVLFPRLSNSMLHFIDGQLASDSIVSDEINDSNKAVLVDSLISNRSIKKDVDSNYGFSAVSKKRYLTLSEIMADTTRDLFQADTLIQSLISEAPWHVGDSIPYFSAMPNTYLDSAMMLLFDTVKVRVYDPADIIPQMSFEVLSNIHIDTVRIADMVLFQNNVTFTIFYPNEIDLFIDMVRVQGGTFKIGSNEHDDDERPAYNLRLSNFLLSKYEVTNDKFICFLNDIKCDSAGEYDELKIIDLEHPMTKIKRDPFTGVFTVKSGYDDYPVVNVSWVGAQMFCKAVGGRLPSEAEWEYAARGGIYAKRYYTGQDSDDYTYEYLYAGGNLMSELGWFIDNSRGNIWVKGRHKPNELGLFDMCGNVWEWCYDKYDKDFYKKNSSSNNPMCLTGPSVRVNRGGGWSSDAMYCRINNRNFLNQFAYNSYLGFRYMREWK